MNNSLFQSEAAQAALSAGDAVHSSHAGSPITPLGADAAAAALAPPQTADPAAAAPAAGKAPRADLPAISALSLPQRKALAALLSGKNVRAAASEAGVDRTTIYRWQTRDLDFIAALNAWRQQSQESARNIMQLAAEHAAQTLLEAVRNGNVAAALAVAKGMGILAPAPAGPTTRQGVGKFLDRAGRQERVDLLKSRVHLEREESHLESDPRGKLILADDRQFETAAPEAPPPALAQGQASAAAPQDVSPTEAWLRGED